MDFMIALDFFVISMYKEHVFQILIILIRGCIQQLVLTIL